MTFDQALTQSIMILVTLIMLGTCLRYLGILKDEHGALFARIVTDVTLPALIFLAVSSHPVHLKQLMPPCVLIVTELICGLSAWGVGRILKLSRPKPGALILASMFSSSAFLGYAVIKELFQNNDRALAEAAIISEFGVGIMIFTLGVAIAIFFGSSNISRRDAVKPILRFFH